MEHIYIKKHYCQHHMCDSKTGLFYHDSHFYVITYNSCIQRGSTHHEQMVHILDMLFGGKECMLEHFEYTQLDKALFQRLRVESDALNKPVPEINYLWDGADSCKFSIQSTVKMKDRLLNNINLSEETKSTIEYLSSIGLKHLIGLVKNLSFYNNTYEGMDERKILDSIDDLIIHLNTNLQ